MLSKNFKADKLNGLYEAFLSPENSYYTKYCKYLEGNYKNGKQEGLWKEWSSGYILEETNYKNGRTVGIRTRYSRHPNNQNWTHEYFYKDNGERVMEYGKQKEIITYKN